MQPYLWLPSAVFIQPQPLSAKIYEFIENLALSKGIGLFGFLHVLEKYDKMELDRGPAPKMARLNSQGRNQDENNLST